MGRKEDTFTYNKEVEIYISHDHIYAYGLKDNTHLQSLHKCYNYLEPITVRKTKKLRKGWRIFSFRNMYLYEPFKILKKRMKGRIKIFFPKRTAPLKLESKTMLGFIAPYSNLTDKIMNNHFQCTTGCKCPSIIEKRKNGEIRNVFIS